MARWKKLRRVYDFYTSDLNYSDFERLFKRDASEVYEFYVKRKKQPDQIKNPLKRTYVFLRDLFLEFLQKLTPIRRLFYSFALLFFLAGYLTEQWNWVMLGFFMLNILLAFELADKLTAKDELVVARDIQNSLLPKSAPVNKFFDIECYYETAREVGGDYYDFIQSDQSDGLLFYMAIGDISGKGMGAALRMVQVQAVLKYLINNCNDPKSVLSALNQNIQHILRPDNFFTVTLASLNCDGQFKLCRAGHTPLIHYKCLTGQMINITPVGLGIGMRDNGMFDKVLEEVAVSADPGDILVFYTDGIVETMNPMKQLFGEEMLKKVIMKNANKSAPEIKEEILIALDHFRQSAIADDDLTLIVMKALPQSV